MGDLNGGITRPPGGSGATVPMRPAHLDNVPTFPGSETGGDGIENGDSSEDSNGGSSLPIFPGFQDEDGDDGLDIDSILPGLPDNGAPAVTNPPPVAPGEFTKGTPKARCYVVTTWRRINPVPSNSPWTHLAPLSPFLIFV